MEEKPQTRCIYEFVQVRAQKVLKNEQNLHANVQPTS